MDQREGDWEVEGAEDISVVEGDVDPMAELAAELAVCLLYLEERNGGFCDWCTCQLKFHCGGVTEECELCGCYELHHSPERNLTFMPEVDHRAERQTMGTDERIYTREPLERARAARDALKELTE